jgi:hypothetical protein
MKDLIEQLREMGGRLRPEAADALEQQAAVIEQMREALRKQAFRAGMLAAAEICEHAYERGVGAKYQGDVFAEAIREAAKS